MKLKRFTTQLVAAGLIAVPLVAHAAGMGRLSVTSALGQPLTAEIELFAADKAELDSLSAMLASDQAFRDAHVELTPVLSSLHFAIEKKPNGKAVLKVTSARPVNDPFIDMLIELNWGSGRLVREYTVLLDPPGVGKTQTAAPLAISPAQGAPAAKAAPVAQQLPPTAPAAPEAPAAGKTQPAGRAHAAPEHVAVKRGDTLIGIASHVRPAGVSLEQTLVGLYRENGAAFAGNMNRLKVGKTLNVPSAQEIAAIPKKEASREITLQADDWRAYRQKLAAAAGAAPAVKAVQGQTSSGKITSKVEDHAKPAPAEQKDVLKLSKVTPPAAATSSKADEARVQQEKQRAREEDAAAREKTLQESGQRAAMLEKQIQDMQKLMALKEKEQAQAKTAAPTAPAAAPTAPAAAPAQPKPTPVAVKAPPASPKPADNWYDPLLADPLYWGGGLAAIGLGGVLWWMMAAGGRRRKPAAAMLDDSSMTGGDIRPSTAAGTAAGGAVNTGDTSFLTDFSQAGLGTIDTHDVDPIAEAEVYMAYGRDAQAEEILKESIGKNPDRPEIRVKLLEIFAARRNKAAFEAAAGELYAALGSKQSPLWEKACQMGRSIDPSNPLYGGEQSSAAPAAATVAATAAVAGAAVAFADAPEPLTVAVPAVAEPQPESKVSVASGPMAFESAGHVLNFDLQPEAAAAPATPEAEIVPQDLSFDLPDLDLTASGDDTLKLDLGLEPDNGSGSKFDFSGLDLDLGDAGGNELELDEVGTKLDLARAYVEMGDKEGAREILNEVLTEGSDKQRTDAKGMLSALG